MKVAAVFKKKDVSSSSEESPGLACVVAEVLADPHSPGDAAAAPAMGRMIVPGPAPGSAKPAPNPR